MLFHPPHFHPRIHYSTHLFTHLGLHFSLDFSVTSTSSLLTRHYLNHRVYTLFKSLHPPYASSTSTSPLDLYMMLHFTHSTVFILDWDDTLLCSSFLQANRFQLDTNVYDLSRPLKDGDSQLVREQYDIALQLRELESCVVALLRQAIPVARCVICTNAESGWVQMSASKFLPNVLPFLEHVTVVSARSSFEHLFPNSPLKWKYYAMHDILIGSGFFGRDGRAHVQKNVISLGDSHVEREAVRAVCKGVPSTRIKTVKFAERPTIEQLRRQLELVSQCFDYIHKHPAELDLQLTVTMNQQQQQQQQNTQTTSTTTTNQVVSSSDADMLTSSEEVKVAADVNTPLQVLTSKKSTDLNINSDMIVEA